MIQAATPIDAAEMPDAPWLDGVIRQVAAIMDEEPQPEPIERRHVEAISILRDASQALAIAADLIHMKATRRQPVELSALQFQVLDAQITKAGFVAKFLAGKL